MKLEDYKGNGERILVVEDDERISSFIEIALGTNNYEVFNARNAEDASKIFNEEGGAFNLFFVDVILPDKSGIELVEEFLSEKPDTKVLLSSGYPLKGLRGSLGEIIKSKGFAFLRKPYNAFDLLKTIKSILREGC